MRRFTFAASLVLTAALTCLAQQPNAQPAPPAQPTGPTTKSAGEQQALQALGAAIQNLQTDPDAVIKAAEELTTKFADTDYKETALSMEAQAYKLKNDAVNTQVYAERVLQVNPKNFQMLLMLGETVDSKIGDYDLDREAKLSKAEKCFHDVVDILAVAPKPNPNVPDEKWAELKQYISAEAHAGLGQVGMQRKKWDIAITELKTAWDADPEQYVYGVRLALAYINGGKPDEAGAICDKILAKPDISPQVKSIVTNLKADAAKAKK
jgi:tetratricopeptide (TPR) repeat protein